MEGSPPARARFRRRDPVSSRPLRRSGLRLEFDHDLLPRPGRPAPGRGLIRLARPPRPSNREDRPWPTHPAPTTITPAEKVRTFPTTPGVYLMKDAQGRVIYVGKAKNLRSRAGSYFQKTAEPTTAGSRDWIGEVADIDFLAADSEVDALLMEARLIKDIQPKHNADLKDDKSFPYLQITTGEDFPRVNFTREPLDRGREALRPVPARQEPARGDPGPAADLQVPHLLARHRGGRPPLALVPALPARTRSTSAPPRATCGSTARPTARTSAASASSSTARRTPSSPRWRRRCSEASKALQFEKAARLRDEIEGAPEPEPPRRPRQARPARGLLRQTREGA